MSHLLPRDELLKFISEYKKTIADEKAEGNMSQVSEKLGTYSIQSGNEASRLLTNMLESNVGIRHVMLESNKPVNIGCSVNV